MTIYATSDGLTYSFQGSFSTLLAAQEWAAKRGGTYLEWYADEGEDEPPAWTRYPQIG